MEQVITRRLRRFRYRSEFGDDWKQDDLVEGILSPDAGNQYQVCIDGSRAYLPEDSGGTWGYGELFEIIQDPIHEEYLDRLQVAG